MNQLLKLFPNIKRNESLSKYTTIKIGGSAEYLVTVNNRDEMVNIIKSAYEEKIPVTIIGWGSNILISDKGIKGLVIINKTNEIKVFNKEQGNHPIEIIQREEETVARLDQLQPEIYGKFEDLDYKEDNLPTSKVYMDSGVSLPLAIFKTIKAYLTGMQWYAGIPGTVGGAVYNNIHGGTHFFYELVDSVDVMTKDRLEIKNLNLQLLKGEYDKSIFHNDDYYILGVYLNLFHGDSEKAMFVSQEWKKRKSIQPQISAGCVWKNLSDEQKNRLNLPTGSIGYLIEHELKLKGEIKGGAQISDKHAGFIENKGKATASDVLYLMKKIYTAAKEKFDIKLEPEIFLLGFEESEIDFFTT